MIVTSYTAQHSAHCKASYAVKRTGTVQAFKSNGRTYYKIRLRLADGSRPWIKERYATEEGAEAALNTLQRLENERGQLLKKKQAEAAAALSVKKTIRNLVPRWLEFRKGHEETKHATWLQFESDMRLYVLPHDVADIDLETDEDLVFKLQGFFKTRPLKANGKGKLAPNSVKKLAVTLTRFFADAIAERWLRLPGCANPMDSDVIRERLPSGNLTGDVIVALPLADAQKLIDAGLPRSARYVFAVATGMREGELSGLKWRDVSLAAAIPSAKVERQLLPTLSFGPPKNNSYRSIPLHPAAIEALTWWHAEGWQKLVGREPLPDDAVFPNGDGDHTRPRSEDIREDLERLGCAPTVDGFNVTQQSTRRTFATALSDAGFSNSIIHRLLRGKGGDVNDRHYIARNLPKFVPAVHSIALSWPKHWPTKIDQNDFEAKNKSRLRELNSRPTVYENISVDTNPQIAADNREVNLKSDAVSVAKNPDVLCPTSALGRDLGQDRAALLAAIDSASRRGDVQAATRLLATLLTSSPVSDLTTAETES